MVQNGQTLHCGVSTNQWFQRFLFLSLAKEQTIICIVAKKWFGMLFAFLVFIHLKLLENAFLNIRYVLALGWTWSNATCCCSQHAQAQARLVRSSFLLNGLTNYTVTSQISGNKIQVYNLINPTVLVHAASYRHRPKDSVWKGLENISDKR